MGDTKFTPGEIEEGVQKLLNKFKQDPQYELKVELGKLLVRHIDSFTPEERKRYDELIEILTATDNTVK